MKKEAVFHYAMKSVFRQKSRNSFIVLIVCLTSVFSLFTASLFAGKNKQIKKNIIETETGHFQIIERNFFERNDPLKPAAFTPELRSDLSGYKITPELLLGTTILHPEGAQELNLIGIDPVSHEEVFPMKEYIEGEWPLERTTGRSVVVGKRFADKLNLSLGDEVVITYQDKTKAILNEALVVTGIYHYYGQGFEGSMAYVSKDFLQHLLQLKVPDAFHRLILFPDKAVEAPVGDKKKFVVKNWNELHPELTVMMIFNDGITRVLIIFMLVIACVSIITPINVLWDERKGEVNLLQTLGATEKVLYLIGTFEAMVVTGFALLVSVAIWLTLHFLSVENGLDFSALGAVTVVRGGILISSVVYPVISPFHTFIIIVFHGAIIFGCQFWCIRKLLKQEALNE